jgi:predicted MPP superfamily phosphohydrolase
VPVTLAKLPKALDGFTIVQLTDVHIGGGPTLARDWLADVVARTNALAPDLIAITGDLVDGSVERLRDEVAPLKDLKARHGVYFVTGNHEYYAGAEAWIAELGRLGIRCLRNERLPITDGLDLAGVDDYHARPDLARALAGRDPNRALVLLAHQPRAVHEAAAQGVCLQLSGHTHGGQIWPWNSLVRLQQPYVAGLVREGQTQLYVSRGTGYWGPPMRLGTHAEITRVTLKAATS